MVLKGKFMSKSKYYWVNRASEYHQQRMRSLALATELVGDVRGIADEKYMMYRLGIIDVPGGGRRYEFLMEYDIYNPSQGIYYGCKSVTHPGFSHSNQIAKAEEDWRNVEPFVLQRLNNVFVDKDFTHRFRPTDNDHNRTFWPFWISLYEEEDPKEVGLRALDIIYRTYNDYFDGKLPAALPSPAVTKKFVVTTAFTEEAFHSFEESVKKNLRKKLSDPAHVDEGWRMVEEFIEKGEQEGWLHRMGGYEKAWCLSEEYGDVDFNIIMKILFEEVGEKLATESIPVPWESLIRIFLRADGSAFKTQVKTLQPAANVRRYWRKKLKD